MRRITTASHLTSSQLSLPHVNLGRRPLNDFYYFDLEVTSLIGPVVNLSQRDLNRLGPIPRDLLLTSCEKHFVTEV